MRAGYGAGRAGVMNGGWFGQAGWGQMGAFGAYGGGTGTAGSWGDWYGNAAAAGYYQQGQAGGYYGRVTFSF